MNHLRTLSGIAFFFVFAAAAPSQEASQASSPKSLTPEASLNLRRIGDLQLSPDGNRLAFVVNEPPKAEARAHHVWLYDKQSGTVRQFTFSDKSESSPKWSPDGTRLAFLSNRSGDDEQIYILRLDGGEAFAVTKGKNDVESFAWSPDSKQLAFVAPDAKTDAEEKKEKDKDDAHVVDKEDKRARLWIMDVEKGDARAVTPANWLVFEAAWLPNGKELIVNATDHPNSDREEHQLYRLQAADGSTMLLLSPTGHVDSVRISPDGKSFGYIGVGQNGPAPNDLLLLSANGGAPRNLTGATLDRNIFQFEWQKDGSLITVYADGFHTKFAAFNPEGTLKDSSSSSALNPNSFAIANSGELFYVGQSATTPQELWSWNQKSAPRQISHLNDSWKGFALATPEFYKYKSFDGLQIEAALLKPANYDGKSKLPLITLIHGGPTGNWEDTIDTWGQLLVTHGYAVFYPNIRGSIGYGEKFVQMNRADWGGGDFKDVMAGIDDLVARGIADPDKLGIGGWSYGGYMSEWAITQTTRFKAAVSGAGLANLISEFGTEADSSYDEWFYGAPYEPGNITAFLNSSPFLYLKNAKTPTLILQGEADTTDPVGQSQELYRGLKRYGVEAELVLYPREPHGLHEEKHLLDRLNRILAWYDKFLK
jgi:dipeptidyl aminopeptidase/acylaminoacyl peptidase